MSPKFDLHHSDFNYLSFKPLLQISTRSDYRWSRINLLMKSRQMRFSSLSLLFVFYLFIYFLNVIDLGPSIWAHSLTYEGAQHKAGHRISGREVLLLTLMRGIWTNEQLQSCSVHTINYHDLKMNKTASWLHLK